ncbi:hypothetical protein SAXI111661_08535 [Saccharomonospora xinjiangensis]|uniref:hypothetical protein n=1 Tax=Saccharomonospora xinjiangensis TaxID=75294 RepID=UPI00106F24EF|nr:hypothetical protein [Saccharomonospora xinjiangensis]QBQ61665.1 hypothetical protein EYD13_16605 [Saccharomonospora xinjiangensis]
MATGGSVLDRALEMQGQVRRLDADASREQLAKSIAQRVRELEDALSKLDSMVQFAQAVSKYSGTQVHLGDLHVGMSELQRQAGSTGLPKERVVETARRRVLASANSLAERSQEAWHAWITEAFTRIPTNRIAGLDPARQQAVRAMVDELGRLGRRNNPTERDVEAFGTKHAAILEELAAARHVPDELLELLSRFGSHPITLRDITDAEIALLREHGMDGEIEIRRK